MTFGQRLTSLRKEYGYNTRNEFAEKLGIPSTTLRNYETDAREPGHIFLKQISEMFNISVDYLLCLTDEKEVLNSFRLKTSETKIIEKYRDLDEHGKKMVDFTLDEEHKRSAAIFNKNKTEKNKDHSDHLTPVAAHNETAPDPEQQRLMKEDLDEL